MTYNTHLRISGEPEKDIYTVYKLIPSGKHNQTVGSSSKDKLLSAIERAKMAGEGLVVKVDGNLLDGEDRMFSDISEVVKDLGLKQRVSV